MKKVLSLVLVLVLVVGVFAACTPKAPDVETPAPDTSPSTTTPDVVAAGWDGKNLAVCLASEPETIDPAINTSVDGANYIQHLFEGLIKMVDSGSAMTDTCNLAMNAPGSAESWEKVVNDDGTVTYTFKMREGAKWSDGEPVTAHDFVYTWQRLATPATAADYAYMIDMVVGYDAIYYGVSTGVFDEVDGEQVEVMEYADPSTLGIEAIDDMTLVINLSYDCPYFEDVCAFPATFPVRKDIIEAYGDQWTFDPATYISNGPFTMTEWVHNSYIKIVPNENYYDVDSISLESITFQLMDDHNAMYSAFVSGDLHFIDEAPQDEISTLLASGVLQIADYIGTYYACFQVEKAPFDNALVREAFSLTIDRNYIVEMVTQTGEVPAGGYVPAGINDAAGADGDDFRTTGGDYYSLGASDYEANCERARALLAEAGYPDGVGFPAVEYMYNTSDAHKAIGEALQNMWKTQLGVDVSLSNQEWGVFLQTRKNGEYQIARNGWIADYNDPCSFLDMWYTDGGNNDAQYSNPAYDALIDAAKSTDVAAERMTAFHAAEDILIGQDHVLAPIYYYVNKYMLDDTVTGLYYTPLGYFFYGSCVPA